MIGEKVGSYRITSKLGEGGMGVVYAAEHHVMNSRAAVKVLRVEHALSDEMAQRFINEATAAATIRHPGIVGVMDVGRLANGVLYILMEYLDGESLGARIKRTGGLPLDDAVSIIQQAARALEAAHHKHIVHRDLKPDNIFLVPDPEVAGGERVKLLDFGIAKLNNDDSKPVAMTKSGAMMGTPLYMSPEQCRGAGEVDHRTDLYALGCILFEMLTGRPPYLGKGVGDLIASHLKDPVPSTRTYNATVPPEFDNIVGMLLAKEPAERFASASALNSALQHAMSHSTTMDPDAPSTADTLPAGSPALDVTYPSYPPASTTSPDRNPATPNTTLGTSAAQIESTPDAPPTARRWLIPALAIAAVGGGLAIYGVTSGGNTSDDSEPTTTTTTTETEPRDDRTANVTPDAAAAAESKQVVACRGGDGAACMALSEQAGSDGDKAASLLEQACTAKHAPACLRLGEFHESGKNVKPDLKLAVKYYEKTCELKDYSACARVRALFKLAFAIDMSVPKQTALAEKACSGEPKYCDGLAYVKLLAARARGKDTLADARKQAMQLYSRACSAKNMKACVQLGSIYSNGLGVPSNKTRAASLFFEACTANEPEGCLQLAFFWADGRGVPNKDPAKAQQLYKKSAKNVEPSCKRTMEKFKRQGIRDWNGMSACATWAFHLVDGLGVKQDKPRALALMGELCKMGHTRSCMKD